MLPLRPAVRDLAYASGVLGARHHLRHRETLTAVMFHRVSAAEEPVTQRADPRYTVPAPLFAACLRFFRRHYNVVGLDQLRRCIAGDATLPPRALLITFDDGWRDNLSVALPILRAQGLPATIFLAASPVTDDRSWWWQEVLLQALRERRASWDELWARAGGGPVPPGERDLLLLLRYGGLDAETRHRILAPLAEAGALPGRHMLRLEELDALAEADVALAAHGAAHEPLSMMPDPGADLAEARRILAPPLAGCGQALDALSFPHGRYDATTLGLARSAGFSLLFTSDPCVNAAPRGRPAALLGRISVEASAIVDAAGAFVPSRLATWLFHRPIRHLAG